MTYLDRSAWTRTPRPVSKLTPLDATRLVGVAVHYTGSTGPLGSTPTLAQSVARLEAERVDHTSRSSSDPTKPWTDIAYQVAFDQAGRVFDCRGIDYRSAANGDQDVNSTHGAVTFLIGVGDQPTQALLDAFTSWYRAVWLRRWPNATRIVGHRDLHATACPGNAVYQLIRAGTLAGPDPGRNPVAALPLDDIGRAVADHTMSAKADYRVHDDAAVQDPQPGALLAPVDALAQTLATVRATHAAVVRLETAVADLAAAVSR